MVLTKEVARSAIGGMVVEEVLSFDASDVASEQVEWLADFAAGKHVCNDLSLIWDVRVLKGLILLRQLSGQVLKAYTVSTLKIEWEDKSEILVLIQLYGSLKIKCEDKSGTPVVRTTLVRVPN